MLHVLYCQEVSRYSLLKVDEERNDSEEDENILVNEFSS
jgi:hypothetical protein